MGYRNYAPAYGHIVDPTGNGDFKTIASANTAATSGNTVFLMPGTYTENVAFKAGVNYSAHSCDAGTPTVQIIGNHTYSGVGTINIANIQLTDNSGSIFTMSGSNASIAKFWNCYFDMTSANAIFTNSASSASSLIYVKNCLGDLGHSGAYIYSNSSAGTMDFEYTQFTSSANSTTNSSHSGNVVTCRYCDFTHTFATSGTTALLEMAYTQIGGPSNSTCIVSNSTLSGTSTVLTYVRLVSGTSAVMTVGSGSTANMYYCHTNSSASPIISGAGTLKYTPMGLESSGAITVTNQTVLGVGPTLYIGDNCYVTTGSGAPSATAPQGSLYLRTDGSGISTRAYINTTGSTTWTAITTVG